MVLSFFLLPSSYVRYASSFFLLPSSFKRLSKRDYVKTRLKVIQGKGLGLFAVDDVRPGALIHEYVEEKERERERERETERQRDRETERQRDGVETETGREKGVRKVERRE